MALDDLYREVILDHFENPRNKEKPEKYEMHEHGSNPLCGDTIELYLDFKDGIVSKVSFEGHGCSISQASVSMLTEITEGKSIEEIKKIIDLLKGMMLEEKPNPFEDDDDLEDLCALEGVKNYPVRIKCALLGWNTLAEAIKKHE